jgi:two-component system cell cycle response regulator CpdR
MDKRPTALVVEDDAAQRALICTLMEECNFHVVELESGEAAEAAMEHLGGTVGMIFIDLHLAGVMTGAEFAFLAKDKFPSAQIVVSSGGLAPSSLPANSLYMQKPWRALELLRIARKAFH